MDRLEQALAARGQTRADVGRLLGLSRAAVYLWRDVPSERVLQVCRALDWAISPHELRPDLYPNPTDGLPSE